MQSIVSGITRRQLVAGMAALAVAAPFASFAGVRAAKADGFRTLDDIKASGKVVIGVFSDKAPFGYVDADGVYQGYDVVFANRLAEDLGVDVEYVATDPANRVPFLESNKVDIILANFTVTADRAEHVDFALPYMKVQLGIVSPDSALITDVEQLKGQTLIVAKGTTAETYFEENYPEIELLKYDAYADAYNALYDGRGAALSTDNTEVLAWAASVPGFSVGVDALGNVDTIAPAVSKGNETLLQFINDEIVALADEQFFHADYEATLRSVYGADADADALVVEGGVVETGEAAAAGYADGVYEAAKNGIGGKVPVTVTIEGGKIVSVEVGENAETQGIGSKAIEQLPELIVAANGTEGVDAVSGASVTSSAIFKGVAECLEAAQA